MYRRLLLPVSRPAEVEPLIRLGAQLLDAGGEIRMLHLIRAGSLPEVTREWRESVHLVVPAHEAGAALGLPVEPEVRVTADVASEILETAETHSVDGILLTLRGDRRSRNPFVGHIGSALLQHAATDVLIVNRIALAEPGFGRILIPTFTGSVTPKSMRVAEQLALANRSASIVALTLTHRSFPVPEAEERSPRGLVLQHRSVSIPERLLGRRHRLPELILQAAARERYGLLLVADEPAHEGGALLTRRFLEDLFRLAPCPVVALRG